MHRDDAMADSLPLKLLAARLEAFFSGCDFDFAIDLRAL
jgi:hypothetical protein